MIVNQTVCPKILLSKAFLSGVRELSVFVEKQWVEVNSENRS